MKSIFKSWKDIVLKFEVFLFMCGIMEDPSPVVNHMCDKFVTEITRRLVSGAFYMPTTRPLFKITKEIRSKKKFLNPLCNYHVYFIWQLPLKQRSRVYYFGDSLDWLGIGDNECNTQGKMDTNTFDCHINIQNPSLPPHDVLQATSRL